MALHGNHKSKNGYFQINEEFNLCRNVKNKQLEIVVKGFQEKMKGLDDIIGERQQYWQDREIHMKEGSQTICR